MRGPFGIQACTARATRREVAAGTGRVCSAARIATRPAQPAPRIWFGTTGTPAARCIPRRIPMPRRSLVRRILRVLVVFALSIVVLLIAALLGARIYFSDRRLAVMIPKLLSDQLAGDFALGRLHWELPST